MLPNQLNQQLKVYPCEICQRISKKMLSKNRLTTLLTHQTTCINPLASTLAENITHPSANTIKKLIETRFERVVGQLEMAQLTTIDPI